ncbi:hypothetical protein AWB71_00686 [Caballeronia peredens]|nr:hypothetical protein AWB71_00686 [Caballeronia peredens]
MNFHPKLFKVIDGETFINGAGVLLMAANTLHSNDGQFAEVARQRAQSTIDALLSAARAGGFTQGDVLETLLSTDRNSERAVDLSIIAMDCIGGAEAFCNALARAGVNPTGGA